MASHRASESVWDYPRPPSVVPDDREVVVILGDQEIVRTTSAVRVLETSHPPTFYVPVTEIADGILSPTSRTTICEFKGAASYWDVVAGGVRSPASAWGYERPRPGYESLTGMVAFYPGHMDSCTVGGETVAAQAGDFYGGWITPEIEGPFKGAPGTMGW